MVETPAFWNLKLYAPSALLPVLEEIMTDQGVALTVLDDPQAPSLEILYQLEPARQYVETLLAANLLPDQLAQVRFELLPLGNMDWIKAVAAQLAPMHIGRWTVHGAAFRNQMSADQLTLQIDATSAFGTGEHPTTRGCLLMLDRLLTRHAHAARRWRMLDMGCGSAILAMAFAKATGAKALGIDMDAGSIEIAQENLRNNNLAAFIDVKHGTGYDPQHLSGQLPFDLIMANVFADPLVAMAGDLARHLRPGGWAILSGILNPQAKRVISAHRQQGLRLHHRMKMGAWSVLALRRPVRQS